VPHYNDLFTHHASNTYDDARTHLMTCTYAIGFFPGLLFHADVSLHICTPLTNSFFFHFFTHAYNAILSLLSYRNLLR
ncbi:hypothetical protein BKA82DRAFT_4229640, partial [Pisolithus tinctorius]